MVIMYTMLSKLTLSQVLTIFVVDAADVLSVSKLGIHDLRNGTV